MEAKAKLIEAKAKLIEAKGVAKGAFFNPFCPCFSAGFPEITGNFAVFASS